MKILIDKRILEIEQKQALYTGNINSYVVDIEFVNDIYDDYLVYIVFKNCSIKKKVLVQCNKVIIPSEVLKEPGDLIVGFFAVKNDNEKVIIYSSNIEMVSITNGGYDEEATYTEEITPTILEQYLQEMKEFYNESIKEYNDNALLETNKFNTNADNRKKEIDALALNIEEDKKAVEKIQEKVELSEQNAKEYADNAKTSEQEAQNSANKALESENNITAIYEDINASKSHIDEQKIKVDKSVENVEKLVENATDQARISTEQAELSTTNAGQVSADKIVVENMKNEISSMKTCVEQTKTDAEQIKTDTQGIYNNTVDAKNETLEAKETVESSLENERIESDKKYARAIETDEIVIDGAGQVELDEDGYMKDFSAESNLPDITQDVRQGHNKFYLPITNFTKIGLEVDVKSHSCLSIRGTPTNTYFAERIYEKDLKMYLENGKTYTLYVEPEFRSAKTKVAFQITFNNDNDILFSSGSTMWLTNGRAVKTFTPSYTGEINLARVIVEGMDIGEDYDFDLRVELVEGSYTLDTVPAYEEYGVSPSLDYPSEFENLITDVEIVSCQENKFNVLDYDGIKLDNEGYIVSTKYINDSEPAVFRGKPNTKYRVIFRDTNLEIKKNTFINIKINDVWTQNNSGSCSFTTDVEGKANLAFGASSYPNIGKEQALIQINEFTEDIPKYSEFKGYTKRIALSEGQFLGKFNGYKNYIEKNKLKGQLKLLTLDGTENWIFSTTKEKTQVFRINGFNIVVEAGYLSNYFIPDVPGDEEKVTIAIDGIYFAVNKEKASTLDEWKALLKRKYEEGNPVKVLYVTAEEFEKDLSLENKSKINSLRVYKGTNNICSNSKIRFKANKNLKNELDKCVKNTDYATNNKSGLIKGRATHGFNIDSSGAPCLSTYDEEYKDLPDSSFVSTGTLKKVEDKILSTSNNKYAKTLKDSVVDKNFAQIYADSSKINNLVIKGAQLNQKVRQGYNLLPYPYVSTTKTQYGVTITDNGDGSITLDGTSTAKIDFGYQWANYLPNDFYTFVTYGLPDTCYTNYYQVGPKYGESVGNFNKVATTENINLGAQLVIPEGVTLNNITIYPMLVQGQYTRETIPVWEQYGASPSLEFPSEFQNVVKNVDIQTNKNNLCKGYENTTNSLKFFHALYIKGLKPATKYTIAFKSNAIDNMYYINEYLTSTELRFKPTGERQVFTFKSRDDITEAYIHAKDAYAMFKNSIDQLSPNEFEEVMLVEGTYTAETMPVFEPYEGEDYSVVLPEGKFNGAIDDFKNEIKKIEDRWYLINKFKHYIFDGVTNGLKFSNFSEKEAFNKFNINLLGKETYIDISRDYWKKVMAYCNYFKNNFQYGDISSGINSNAIGKFAIWSSGVDFFSFAIEKERFSSLEEANAKLKELYDAGTPMEIYALASEGNYEYIELPEETQELLNSIELMEGLNNISVDNGTMSFEYNKSLARAFEEEREEKEDLKTRVSNLENQILELLGGN